MGWEQDYSKILGTMVDQILDNSLSYESAVYSQPISHIKIIVAKIIWGAGQSAGVGVHRAEYMHYLP